MKIAREECYYKTLITYYLKSVYQKLKILLKYIIHVIMQGRRKSIV